MREINASSLSISTLRRLRQLRAPAPHSVAPVSHTVTDYNAGSRLETLERPSRRGFGKTSHIRHLLALERF